MILDKDTIIVPFPRRMTKWHLTCVFPLLLSLWGCNSGRDSLAEYYFPFRDCQSGLIYVYEPLDNPGQSRQIWHLQSVQTDTGWVLHTRIYDAGHTLVQEITEWEVANGTLALSYIRHARDSADQPLAMPLEILRPNLFPYDIPDTSRVFTFQLQFADPRQPGVVTTRTRARQWKGITTMPVLNQERTCLVLALREKIEIDDEGIMTLEFPGEEVYARGLGLVAWQQIPVPGDTVYFLLRERLSPGQFESAYGPLP